MHFILELATVITNGLEAKVFDSITGDLIEEDYIYRNHEYILSGCKIYAEDQKLRSEALEKFVSLSSSNLIAFCKSQVEFRMRRLRGEDHNSGKKYIPKLYLEREESRNKLEDILDRQYKRTAVIFGSPQVGKTNFICNFVEKRLEEGIPCLFYPAISMKTNLVDEIADDFEWISSEQNNPSLVVKNLLRILRNSSQRMTIFVDGWNEASQRLASEIDFSTERLNHEDIQIVISLTDVSASRLLVDSFGNPSHIAEAASISKNDVSLIEISPDKLKGDRSAVEIKKYFPKEIDIAYDNYSKIYNVSFSSSHKKVSDPFLLRVAMEIYQGSELPDILDEPTLLADILASKAERAPGQDKDSVISLLTSLAGEMFEIDAPVSSMNCKKIWNMAVGSKLPEELFNAALLAKVHKLNKQLFIDFYYGRERDFVIACWAMGWGEHFSPANFSLELEKAFSTNAGTEAVSWFLQQKSYLDYLKEVANKFSTYTNPAIKRSILTSMRNNPGILNASEREWVLRVIQVGTEDKDLFVRIEAAKLIVIYLDDPAKLTKFLFEESDLKEVILRLVEVAEEYPFEEGSISEVIMEALKSLHMDLMDYEVEEGEYSEVTGALIDLTNHSSADVRCGAIEALGYCSPVTFFNALSSVISNSVNTESHYSDWTGGIYPALSQLREIYHGSMCPGYLECLSDDPEQHTQEYEELKELLKPIIEFYGDKEYGLRVKSFLQSIAPE
jgi:hypothetical protein